MSLRGIFKREQASFEFLEKLCIYLQCRRASQCSFHDNLTKNSKSTAYQPSTWKNLGFEVMGASFGKNSYTFDGPPPSWFRASVNESQDLRDKVMPLHVTLEELLTGTLRRVKFERRVGTKLVAKELQVRIKPGCPLGTKIRCPGAGDKPDPNRPAGDVVFEVHGKPHLHFKQNGKDLYYIAKISMKDALCGKTLLVPKLTGGFMKLDLNKQSINPTLVRRIPGQGLPEGTRGRSKRGDLLVMVDIEFPSYMTQEAKDELMATCSDHMSLW